MLVKKEEDLYIVGEYERTTRIWIAMCQIGWPSSHKPYDGEYGSDVMCENAGWSKWMNDTYTLM